MRNVFFHRYSRKPLSAFERPIDLISASCAGSRRRNAWHLFPPLIELRGSVPILRVEMSGSMSLRDRRSLRL